MLANLNLLRRDLDPHERELSIDEATSEAQRMRRLINELLLLAQADATQVIARAPLRLDELVLEAVAAVQRQAPDPSINCRSRSPLMVIGDEERLTQLVRNLLENAAKYTPPGTTVNVRMRQSGRVAQLIVADSGAWHCSGTPPASLGSLLPSGRGPLARERRHRVRSPDRQIYRRSARRSGGR